MASNFTPTSFTVQNWDQVSFFHKSTGALIASSRDVKTGNLDNAMTLVYPMGGTGNVYVAPAFAHSKRSTIDFTFATINIDMMGMQIGATPIQGSTSVYKIEDLTVGTNVATTTFVATGTAGTEIKYVQVVDAAGSTISTLTQVASTPTGATTFQYTPGTKTLTFFSGTLTAGTIVRVGYVHASGASARTITNLVTGAPQVVTFVGMAFIRDKCTGDLYYAQVIGATAQIDGNWNWQMAADGDPSTQTMKMEFIRACGTNELYHIVLLNEGDSV